MDSVFLSPKNQDFMGGNVEHNDSGARKKGARTGKVCQSLGEGVERYQALMV